MDVDEGDSIIKLVLDTNVVIAALLWRGKPRQLLELIVAAGSVRIFSSPALLQELARTLGYPKFARRIEGAETSVEGLLKGYLSLISIVMPASVPRVVPADADDDHVIAAAVAAQAKMIVSGDSDLLELKHHGGMDIVTVAQALDVLGIL